MASIRRYGPSMVAPEVMPRPQMGQGAQATFGVFEDAFAKVNDFIRPAVVRHKTAQAEAQAIEAVDATGPQFELVETRGPGNVAIEAVEGRPTQGGAIFNALQSGGGPTNQALQSLTGGGFDFFSVAVGGAAARPDSFDRLNPTFRSGVASMLQAAKADGIDLRITSAFRSPELQAELYQKAVQKYGSEAEARRWVAPPGSSMHNHGMAVDFADASGNLLRDASGREAQWLKENAGRFGLDVPLSNEPWQVEPLGATRGVNAAMPGGTPAQAVNMQTAAEYELQQVNASTFEPRLPFTVADQAFNAAADRVIQSRAMVALDHGIAAAQQAADGDLGKLREEMEKVRATVLGGLPEEMPGLRTSLEETFARSAGAAEKQAISLAQRRVVAQQNEAMAQAVGAIESEAQRLALTGASGPDIAAHLTNSQAALAQFGPRQGFTLNGQEYPPDPTRAGTMTPAAIAQQLGNISNDTRRIMIEAEFERSAAPGQFVDEFRRQVMGGNSPLPAGESLNLLRQLEGRARASESARRTAANAARSRVQEETNTRINAFVEMTEAGVPVAIPDAERQQILAALSPYPELQREALEKFAVADAAVVTHGMSGPEVLAYVDAVRADVQASVERGELDMQGVAVIQSLEDRVKKIQDAITAEMVGLPLIEQLAMDGATAEQVDYDGLRVQAAGNPDVIEQINEVEAFHRDIEQIRHMSANEREAALEVARARLAELAASGEGYGAQAVMTQKVVDRLAEWSDHRKGLASSDAMAFAEAAGVALPGFEGAEGLGDVGSILSERVAALKPLTMAEGVENPVPLSRAEIDTLTDIYRDSSRGQQMAFIASVSSLGEDQASAVFERIGASEPTLFAAGSVYAMGNQAAASMILRGSVDVKLDGGEPGDVALARQAALGDVLSNDLLRPDSIEGLDRVALAYARGLALSEGGRPITQNDIQDGFEIATGRQEDGTGGVVSTEYGLTIAPRGWVGSTGIFGSGKSIEGAINSIDDDRLLDITGGQFVFDAFDRPIFAQALRESIEGLLPSDDPFIFTPVDINGAVFVTSAGGKGGHIPDGILQIDLRDFE